MRIDFNILESSEYKREIKKSKRKHRPVQVILVDLLAIAYFNVLREYAINTYKSFRNPNSKKCKKVIKSIAHETKHIKTTMDKIKEHEIVKDERYSKCREFHPYRIGSWGSSLDKLVVLYKIIECQYYENHIVIEIRLIRTGNHDF